MIKFDLFTLEDFLRENSDFLTGARVQKIRQPTRQELIFILRAQGEIRKFYVNINPEFYHICFMSAENEKKRFIQVLKNPPMFCMLLRKYIQGAKIAKVVQPKTERILELYFEVYNEISEKIYMCLAIELMGKHSNAVLYNYDTNVIIGCAHNVGSDKSRQRELIGGLPYAYPLKNQSGKFLCLSENFDKKLSVNENIDNYFANLQAEKKIKELKSKLFSHFKSNLKKVEKALLKHQKQFSSKEKADLYRKKGDLIMAGINEVKNKNFSDFIEVIDWETNAPLKIELDKTQTLKENANRYYKLYKKAKTAGAKSQEIVQNLQKEKDYLEQVLYSVENAQTTDEFLEIEEEMGKQETGNRKQKRKKTISLPFTLHISPFTVYIGKNNKQNDYVVSKLAKDEDLWFHVKNCAGSHVLLGVNNRGEIPTDEIILQCAKLAKEYSAAKDSTKAAVIYTKAKYLKKPPGTKPGYVTFTNEKEIVTD